MEKFLDFTIIEELGSTIGSRVYRANRENDNTVIIKVLKTKKPTASDIARFKQEYELIKSLDYPGIIKTLNFIETGGIFALIFEDFGGISLGDLLNNHKPGIKEFLEIAIQVSEAIAYIHEKNIIHKDIKPSTH